MYFDLSIYKDFCYSFVPWNIYKFLIIILYLGLSIWVLLVICFLTYLSILKYSTSSLYLDLSIYKVFCKTSVYWSIYVKRMLVICIIIYLQQVLLVTCILIYVSTKGSASHVYSDQSICIGFCWSCVIWSIFLQRVLLIICILINLYKISITFFLF